MDNSDDDSDAYFGKLIEVPEEDQSANPEIEEDEFSKPDNEEEEAEDENDLPVNSESEDSESEGFTQSQHTVKEPEERNFVDSDGEDHVEVCEYEVAIAVYDYKDDREGVRHDEYYDSGEGSDEEVARRRRKSNFTPRHDGILFKGQKFFNRLALKEAVMWDAMKNKRNIRKIRYDKMKNSFSCLGKARDGSRCGWKAYASVRKGHTKWRIRSIAKRHSCEKSGTCKMLKVDAIARIFHDKIRDEPDFFKPQRMEKVIFQRWGISVSVNQVQSARVRVLKWLEKEYDDQFIRLRDYSNELLISNPGTTVEVQCIKNEAGEDVFRRFYVCFSVLQSAWKETCRPLIGIDGTFLKGKVPGMLLVALGRDGDNRIYHVAWGIVEKENTDNWSWFVKKIRKYLVLGDGSGFVMISDRHKGLISVVSSELPGIEHRHCVRHIYGNLKAKFGKRYPMKKFIWDLAWSYNDVEYRARLKDIENFDDEVYTYVINSDPTSWCRAFFKLGPCCEDVENNSTESFNKSICKAREKPFVPMLEMIRTQAMTRIHSRNKKSQRHLGTLTPYATGILDEEETEAQDCSVVASTGGMIHATIARCSHLVSLPCKTCYGRKWQIRGIPCEHAYGVILKKQLNVDDYVAHWFHSETWRRTYENGIIPPRGSKFWPQGTLPIHYPHNTQKKGYEEKKRKREKNESPQKSKRPREAKREIHCSVCTTAGHNSRFHDKDNEGTGPEIKGKRPEKKGKGKEIKKQQKPKKGKETKKQQNPKNPKETKKQQKPKGIDKQKKRTTKKKGK